MSKNKKVVFIIFVIVLLVAIFLVVNTFLFNTRILSMTNLFLDGEVVKLSTHAKDKLDAIYDNAELEIPSCISGEVVEEGIRVLDVEMAEIITNNETSVTYIRCSRYIGSHRTIGTLHNHPNGNCRLSGPDIETYTVDMTRGQEIIGLSCSEGYKFYVLASMDSVVEEW